MAGPSYSFSSSRQNAIASSNFGAHFSSSRSGEIPKEKRLRLAGDITVGLWMEIGDTEISPNARTMSFGGFGISKLGASDGRFGFRPRLLSAFSPRSIRSSRRLRLEFQRFFTELSVLPGSNAAILLHLFPHFRWCSMRMLSSLSVHSAFTTVGQRWLCHLSRHCLLMRPGSFCANAIQSFAPCSSTQRTIVWSSAPVYDPLTRVRSSALAQRSEIWCAVFVGK